MSEISNQVKQLALELGFHKVGIAKAVGAEVQRLQAWLKLVSG